MFRITRKTATTPARTRILVIQPDPNGDLDRFATWLEAEGIQLRVVRPFLGEPVPSNIDASGLIVLGGSMAATDEGEHPWLVEIKALLRTAVAGSVPTLGVCLGAQLLADALGGEVRPGDVGLECGVVAVRWLDAAKDDPLLSGQQQPFLAGAFHFDVIAELPPGAVLLGSGEKYPHQAFRIGDAWGVQFHPEISPERFHSWRVEAPPTSWLEYDGNTRVFQMLDEEVIAGTRELAKRFAHIVRDRVRTRSSS